MSEEQNEMDELSRDIRKIIDANRKFLERVMDDEFEPDGTDGPEEEEFEEL